MPDDKPVDTQPQAEPEQSDLDKLFEEASRQATDPTKVSTCSHADSDVQSRRWCRNCKKLICQFCWSVLDPNYCVECMQRVDLQIKDEVVTDDDGIAHQGRLITPTSEFNALRWVPNGKTTSKLLSEMSALELEEYITSYKSAVHDAERALDIRRIRLGSAQLELEERKSQERRQLRADKTKYPVRTVTFGPNGKQVKSTASTAKLADMLKMLEQLQKLKQMKTSQSGGSK